MKKLLIVFCALAFGVISFAQVGQAANLITNPSFETYENTSIFGYPGVPSVFGDWGGDPSEIVGPEDGISPYDGNLMLRFIYTGNDPDILLTTSQVWQLIDVSSYAADIASGNAAVSASAWFNRVEGDAKTDTIFSFTVYAFDSTSGTWLQHNNAGTMNGSTGASVNTDADVDTWEEASLDSWTIPSGTNGDTDTLMFRLVASENIENDGTHPEFDGHYADMVSLEISGDSSPQTVDIDIKFCSNPNAFNCKSKGKTPVTIFGTEDLDVADINISSLRICIDGTCVESPPSSWSVADRGDPTTDLGAEECAIVEDVEQDYLNPDGYLDLDVAFDSQQIATLIDCSELVKNDVSDTLYLTGELVDGTPIYSEPVGDPGIDQLVKKK